MNKVVKPYFSPIYDEDGRKCELDDKGQPIVRVNKVRKDMKMKLIQIQYGN